MGRRLGQAEWSGIDDADGKFKIKAHPCHSAL